MTADRLSPTNDPLQVGVALACIGVALFDVGVARATPKVYKSPPLVQRVLGPYKYNISELGMYPPRRDTPSEILKFIFCVLGFVVVVVPFGMVIPLLLFLLEKITRQK